MESFIFYESFYEAMRYIDDPDARLETYEAITSYALTGTEPENFAHPEAAIVFTMAKPQINANQQRRESGSRGGRPKKTSVSDNDKTEKPMVSELKTNGFNTGKPMVSNYEKDTFASEKPNVNVNVNVNDNVNGNVNLMGADTHASKNKTAEEIEPLPIKDGEDWRPTEKEYTEYKRLYSSVDIPEEFKRMRGWFESDPSRLKPREKIKTFVNSWLSNESKNKKQWQRKGRKPAGKTFNDFPQRNYNNISELLQKKQQSDPGGKT